ncbi:MAG: glycosyltransferase [bacterium]|nr:glycosyltransferase [bacterium]
MNITLVIPCYNEEINIQKGVLDKFGNYTQRDNRFEEVIIVDDGSTDDSKKLIKEKYIKVFPKFRLIENNHQGKAYAIITGIKQAKGTQVMFSDIDLATPIEEAEKLIKHFSDTNLIIIGSRKKDRKGAPILRKIMSLGSVLVKSFFLGLRGIQDTQCGFKLFDKKSAQKIIESLKVFHNGNKISGSSVSAGFDLEFLFIASKKGYKIVEEPVEWKHVETKNVNFIKDTYESIRDILLIKKYDLMHKYD